MSDIKLASGKEIIDESYKELKENGQQKDYVVLNESERMKGFVRPLRNSYKHLGVKPKGQLRDLTKEEKERYEQFGYVKFEEYENNGSVVGRYWTEAQLKSGCNSVTTISNPIAETYARNPKFYGSTFCCHCKKHFRLEEFVWVEDGTVVGS